MDEKETKSKEVKATKIQQRPWTVETYKDGKPFSAKQSVNK